MVLASRSGVLAEAREAGDGPCWALGRGSDSSHHIHRKATWRVGHNLINIYKNAPLGLLWLHTVKLSSVGAPFLVSRTFLPCMVLGQA